MYMYKLEADFLKAIIAEPYNDELRLLYADWLEEHDQEIRSQYIKLQIMQSDSSLSQEIKEQAWIDSIVMLKEFWKDWHNLPIEVHNCTNAVHPSIHFTRGFVSQIIISEITFSNKIMESNPITRVVLYGNGFQHIDYEHLHIKYPNTYFRRYGYEQF